MRSVLPIFAELLRACQFPETRLKSLRSRLSAAGFKDGSVELNFPVASFFRDQNGDPQAW